ncbi:type I secretion system permease/ATPase [Kordiimonas aestuarii]|uniref:type I secretion system permease/ATPase n=1 Tax=Kordiimonas aestuarii TaxID=1005925 RepID=UPI0021D1F8F3|nr:type I secretion system permease/ATPase [Kordiimonas aestuarii]
MSVYDEFKAERRKYLKSIRMVGVLAIFGNVAMLAMPAFMFQVYTRVLQAQSVETLVALLVICLIILVAYGFLEAAKNNLLSRAAVRLESRIAGPLLAGELAQQKDANGESLKDLAFLRTTLSSPSYGAIFDLPFMPFFLFILYFIHPLIGVVVTIGAGLLLALAVWGNRISTPFNQDTSESMIKAYRRLDSHMRSQEIIRAQGSYVESVNDWGQHQGKHLSSYLDSFDMTARFGAASKAARQILQILITAVGAALVLGGDADFGVIFGAAIIGARALQPMEQIVGGWRQLIMGREAYDRLCKRMEELKLPENRTPLPRPRGELTVARLAYMPSPKSEPILRNINCVIKPGDCVAVIGGSGSGKSTLARLLVGYLEPTTGHVKLDGTPLNVWDPVAKGLYIGYLPQQQQLYESTVAENIARLRTEDEPHMVIEAAKRAGVHEILQALPQGYDTLLSRSGFWPSGGQAQMIALARAMYADPQVVVLDEPETGLDSQSEGIFHKVMEAMREEGKTVVVITHRPSALRYVNKVMFMRAGQIQDFGPRDEVLKKNGITTVAAQRAAKKSGAAQGGGESKQNPSVQSKIENAN